MRTSSLRTVFLLATVALFAGACSTFQQKDDKTVSDEIQAKIFQDPVLKTRDIRVTSEKGVVVLNGSVATQLEKSAVERMANQVSGVKQVINQLGVGGGAASQEIGVSESDVPIESAKPLRVEPLTHRAPPKKARAKTPAPLQAAEAAPAVKPAEAAQSTAPAPPPPPQPVRVTVAAGTVIKIRMIDGIDSARNHPGDEFAASLDAPIVVGDREAIPSGADARVRLVEAKSAGHMTGSSELQIELIEIVANGNSYPVQTAPYQLRGASRGKRTAETVGGGAAVGAIIGAIAGGGKGAAIGAAVGAGGGTAVQGATRGQQVKIPSETKLEFTLKDPFTVTM